MQPRHHERACDMTYGMILKFGIYRNATAKRQQQDFKRNLQGTAAGKFLSLGLNCNAEEHLLDISKDRLKSVNIIHPCTRVHNGLAGTCSSYDAVCAHLLGLSLKPLTVTFACPVYLNDVECD